MDVTAPITGMATGTPGYIDPACSGGRVAPSAASDLYALGATLYRCLAGQLPAQVGVSSEGVVLLDARVTSGKKAPESLATRRNGLPMALVNLVDRLVSPRAEVRPRGALQVEYELERIRLELGGRRHDLPPENEGPFRGLRRFEARDRDVFFGRRNELTKAIEILRGRGLVALLGASGSGKSSLARAALLPALVEGDLAKWPKAWDVAIVEPGRDPWHALVTALQPFIPEAPLLDAESIVALMEERANVEDRGIALFVDQLEELVTTSLPESRDEAAALLAAMGERPIPGVRAIVAARTDLLDPLLGLPALGNILLNSSCMVDVLRSLDWRESVTRALAAYGYEFEDKTLEDELFRGIDRAADAMPLVEFALAEMWNARDREKERLTRASFEKIGGIEGALELHAEATMTAMADAHADTEPVVRAVLLALTTPEGTRRSQNEDELVKIAGEKARDVIAAFTKARLLVPSKDGVTLTHEALLTGWARLRSWIVEARADRMLAEELERDSTRWTNDPDRVALWAGRRLAFAREIARKKEIHLSPNAHTFVRTSVRASRRRYAFAISVTTVIAVVLFGIGAKYVQTERELRRAVEELARTAADVETQNRLLDILAGKSIDRPIPTQTTSAPPPAPPPSASSLSSNSSKGPVTPRPPGVVVPASSADKTPPGAISGPGPEVITPPPAPTSATSAPMPPLDPSAKRTSTGIKPDDVFK